MTTNKMIIQLNREQRVFLLQALKDGYIDLDALDVVGIRRPTKFDHMTDEQLADELVRMDVCIRTCTDPITERICKACYHAGGCWLSWKARDDRELHDRIRNIMERKT
jgi:hypothetical protein